MYNIAPITNINLPSTNDSIPIIANICISAILNFIVIYSPKEVINVKAVSNLYLFIL